MLLLDVNFALSENFAIKGLPNTLSFGFALGLERVKTGR